MRGRPRCSRSSNHSRSPGRARPRSSLEICPCEMPVKRLNSRWEMPLCSRSCRSCCPTVFIVILQHFKRVARSTGAQNVKALYQKSTQTKFSYKSDTSSQRNSLASRNRFRPRGGITRCFFTKHPTPLGGRVPNSTSPHAVSVAEYFMQNLYDRPRTDAAYSHHSNVLEIPLRNLVKSTFHDLPLENSCVRVWLF